MVVILVLADLRRQKTLDNIERVRLAIEGDCRLTVRELENNLGIPKTTVWEILNKILRITRFDGVTGHFTTITRQRIHRVLCNDGGYVGKYRYFVSVRIGCVCIDTQK